MEFVSEAWWLFCFRWLHILCGVMWIGHLWYFNFTQTPTVPKIPPELAPAIPRFIMPPALFWFRWGAMGTIIFGLIMALMSGYLGSAIVLGIPKHSAHDATIGFGMWMGTIMWFNVWFIIWPNQKKLLGMVPATDEEKKRARPLAGRASRINTLLSIPMLYCMAGVHFYS